MTNIEELRADLVYQEGRLISLQAQLSAQQSICRQARRRLEKALREAGLADEG